MISARTWKEVVAASEKATIELLTALAHDRDFASLEAALKADVPNASPQALVDIIRALTAQPMTDEASAYCARWQRGMTDENQQTLLIALLERSAVEGENFSAAVHAQLRQVLKTCSPVADGLPLAGLTPMLAAVATRPLATEPLRILLEHPDGPHCLVPAFDCAKENYSRQRLLGAALGETSVANAARYAPVLENLVAENAQHTKPQHLLPIFAMLEAGVPITENALAVLRTATSRSGPKPGVVRSWIAEYLFHTEHGRGGQTFEALLARLRDLDVPLDVQDPLVPSLLCLAVALDHYLIAAALAAHGADPRQRMVPTPGAGATPKATVLDALDADIARLEDWLAQGIKGTGEQERLHAATNARASLRAAAARLTAKETLRRATGATAATAASTGSLRP